MPQIYSFSTTFNKLLNVVHHKETSAAPLHHNRSLCKWALLLLPSVTRFPVSWWIIVNSWFCDWTIPDIFHISIFFTKLILLHLLKPNNKINKYPCIRSMFYSPLSGCPEAKMNIHESAIKIVMGNSEGQLLSSRQFRLGIWSTVSKK